MDEDILLGLGLALSLLGGVATEDCVLLGGPGSAAVDTLLRSILQYGWPDAWQCSIERAVASWLRVHLLGAAFLTIECAENLLLLTRVLESPLGI